METIVVINFMLSRNLEFCLRYSEVYQNYFVNGNPVMEIAYATFIEEFSSLRLKLKEFTSLKYECLVPLKMNFILVKLNV